MTAHERLLERTTEPPSDIPVPRQKHSGNVVRINPQDGSRIAQSGLLGFQTKTMKKQAQRKRARHHDDGDPALSAAVDVVALQSATLRNDMQAIIDTELHTCLPGHRMSISFGDGRRRCHACRRSPQHGAHHVPRVRAGFASKHTLHVLTLSETARFLCFTLWMKLLFSSRTDHPQFMVRLPLDH